MVPHITDAIQEWVEKIAQKRVSDSNKPPEVCIIELGGIIGDIESMAFVEAFRQFQFRVGKDNFCVAHVSLIPQVRKYSILFCQVLNIVKKMQVIPIMEYK